MPFDREDVEPLHDRLDQLLGQIDDGLTRENFPDRFSELEGDDWERWDSVAAQTLMDDYLALEQGSGCLGIDKELQEAANAIFREYVDVIRDLGSEGFGLLVDSVLADYAVGECEDECKRRYRNAKIKKWGLGVAMWAGCGALAPTVLLAGACISGVGVWGLGEGSDNRLDYKKCLEDCAEEEDGPPAAIIPRNGNLGLKN